jgi:hypothetical protein
MISARPIWNLLIYNFSPITPVIINVARKLYILCANEHNSVREMGWRARGFGPWPGRGPFGHLPPWERPGWLCGPKACWWLYAPRPYAQEPTPAEEVKYLEAYMKDLKQELESVEARIKELKETESKE